MTSMRAARAAGSDRRDNRDRHQHERRDKHRQCARHLDVQEISSRQTRQHEPKCRACKDARRSHHGALCDHALEESLRFRSKGQPDAEFPRPRAHRKRQHARDAHHCDRQRDSREYAKHQRV